MNEKIITLPKLGNRVYVHGTTLYEELIKLVGNYETLEFQIKKPLFSNLVKICKLHSWDVPGDVNSILFYKYAGAKYSYYVYDGNYKDETLREPFEESESLFELKKSDDEIDIFKSPYNFIKTIVAINKILLSKYLESGLSYLFVYLKLDTYVALEFNGSITLKKSRIIGDYFYTDILKSGKKVGVIGFKKHKSFAEN